MPLRTSYPTSNPARTSLGLAILLLLVAAAPPAQVAATWRHPAPIEASDTGRSSRLLAMGDLSLAADGQSYRFNSFEYGGNPAGLLGSRDTSWVEQGTEYADFHNEYYGQAHSAVLRRSGFPGSGGASEKWAPGVASPYSSPLTSRHDEFTVPDNARFIRDFDLPFASSSQPI